MFLANPEDAQLFPGAVVSLCGPCSGSCAGRYGRADNKQIEQENQMTKFAVRSAALVGLAAVALWMAAPAHAAKDPNKPKAEALTVSGTIDAIDATAGTLTVKTDTESKSFSTSPKCHVRTADKKEGATLSDLKVGDKVTVHYHDKKGTLTAVAIMPQSAGKHHKNK